MLIAVPFGQHVSQVVLTVAQEASISRLALGVSAMTSPAFARHSRRDEPRKETRALVLLDRQSRPEFALARLATALADPCEKP